MKLINLSSIIFCLLIIAGCSSISTKKVQYSKNYSLNAEMEAVAGGIMIKYEEIKYIRGSRMEGLPQSKNYWQSVEYPSEDSFAEKLIYKGRSGNTVFITYMRKDSTRPAFYKELSYDLALTDTILFKNYSIRILDASDNYIRFIVIED